MARKNIAAGNWKMNTSISEGTQLAKALSTKTVADGTEVIIAVPFTHLQSAVEATASNSKVFIAAQNCNENDKGAYTGEISVDMIDSIGATHVVLGHSERREIFNESNELLKAKVDKVLEKGLTPIFCCGENLEIRESGKHIDFVKGQLTDSLAHLSADSFSKIIVAYEPIWAIGTGKTASPEQAQEMQEALRAHLAEHFGAEAAQNCSILYGGSVKPGNAKELFSQPDVDGGLVGGASLDAEGFGQIIDSF